EGGTTQAEYRYNAIGERLVKVLNNQTVIYSYNQNGQLLEEAYYNANNKLFYTRNYAWLGTQPIAMLEQWLNDKGQSTKQQVAYIHSDHLNTPRVATNAAGQAVWQWQSDAFGIGLANEDVDGDGQKTVVALRFPGQVFDPESGLHYNYFRDYDPNLGRYVQSDPIGLQGGLNTYAYVLGNPLKFMDPFGLEIIGEWIKEPGIDENWGFRRNRDACTTKNIADCYWKATHSGLGMEVYLWFEVIVSEGLLKCSDTETCEEWTVEVDGFYNAMDITYKGPAPGLICTTVAAAGRLKLPTLGCPIITFTDFYTKFGQYKKIAYEAARAYIASLTPEQRAALCKLAKR
ncbi:hypothetical protein H0A36_28595, partial [Endozoicomonas sp. SM1973]